MTAVYSIKVGQKQIDLAMIRWMSNTKSSSLSHIDTTLGSERWHKLSKRGKNNSSLTCGVTLNRESLNTNCEWYIFQIFLGQSRYFSHYILTSYYFNHLISVQSKPHYMNQWLLLENNFQLLITHIHTHIISDSNEKSAELKTALNVL